MAMIRDHFRPCEHAPPDAGNVLGDEWHIGHSYMWAPAHTTWCPGGAAIEIDRQAATEAFMEAWNNPDLGIPPLTAFFDALGIGGSDE